MLISAILLSILYGMEAFLVDLFILIVIPYCVDKVRDEITFRVDEFHFNQETLREEEENVERFIHELYEWAQKNSNLISVR